MVKNGDMVSCSQSPEVVVVNDAEGDPENQLGPIKPSTELEARRRFANSGV